MKHCKPTVVRIGDLVRHKSFLAGEHELLGIVTDIDPGYAGDRIMVLWSYDPGYGQHTPHHPDRLEIVNESSKKYDK